MNTVPAWPRAAIAEAELREQWPDAYGAEEEPADALRVAYRESRECPLCGGRAYGGAARWKCAKGCRDAREEEIERLEEAGLCIFCEGTGCSCAELHLCATCRMPCVLRGGKLGCRDCYAASGRSSRFPIVRAVPTAARADNVYETAVAYFAQTGFALRAMAAEKRWRLRLRALLVYAATPLTFDEVADLANEEGWEAKPWTRDRVRYAVDEAGAELLRRLRDQPFGRPKGRRTLAEIADSLRKAQSADSLHESPRLGGQTSIGAVQAPPSSWASSQKRPSSEEQPCT
jgi:hypothetical protein